MKLKCLLTAAISGILCAGVAEAGFGVFWKWAGKQLGGGFGDVLTGAGELFDEVGSALAPMIPGVGSMLQKGSDVLELALLPKKRMQSRAKLRMTKIAKVRKVIEQVKDAADSFVTDKDSAALRGKLLEVNVEELSGAMTEAVAVETVEEGEPARSKQRKSLMLNKARMQAKVRKAVLEFTGELDETGKALQGLSYALSVGESNLGEDVEQLRQLHRAQQMEKVSNVLSEEGEQISLANIEMIQDMQKSIGGSDDANNSTAIVTDSTKQDELLDRLNKEYKVLVTGGETNVSESTVVAMCNAANDLDIQLSEMERAVQLSTQKARNGNDIAKLRRIGNEAVEAMGKLTDKLDNEMEKFEIEASQIKVASLLEDVSIPAWTCIEAMRDLAKSKTVEDILKQIFDERAIKQSVWQEQAHDLQARLLSDEHGAVACMKKLQAAISGTDKGKNIFAVLKKKFEVTFSDPPAWINKAPIAMARSVPTLGTAVSRMVDMLISLWSLGETIKKVELLADPNRMSSADDGDTKAMEMKEAQITMSQVLMKVIKDTFQPCAMSHHVHEAARNLRIICDEGPQIDQRDRTCPRTNLKRSVERNTTKRGTKHFTKATIACLPKPKFDVGTLCQFNCLQDANPDNDNTDLDFKPFVCGLTGTWSSEPSMRIIRKCNMEALGVLRIMRPVSTPAAVADVSGEERGAAE